MDRPISAASSNTASTAPAHKRNASVKNASKPTGPSIVQLFLTNLRLLNFDLLSDWPAITAASFTTQDTRTRIKSTEYALYQLFRLHDPNTTADKLQPFFPPLEPLQSVNLRAALYRCLNDLKKNGVLPKETVFRKSMLDDCQGDKFWEACLSFSAVVVRKTALERKAKYGRPVAERLGTAQTVGKTNRKSMLPLAMAHKSALSRVLKERERKQHTYARLHDVLCEKKEELQERKAKSSRTAQKTKTLPHDKAKAVEDAINKNWVGSVELKDALVGGDTCAQGDGILVEAFDQLWKQNGEQGIAVSNGADVGLLQSLSSRATQQSVRLRMWQHYLDRLVTAKPKSRGSLASSASQKTTIRFDKHRDINLKAPTPEEEESSPSPSSSPSPPPPPPPPEGRHVSASRYDEILTAMREELRKNSGHRSASQSTPSSVVIMPLKRAQTQPMPVLQPSLTLDTSSGAQDSNMRSPSHTAVPVRPRMGRRVSSQSKTYEKPKVESQREPIPLKSELFSPLKENRRSNLSFATSAPSLAASIEETEAPDAIVKTNGRGVSFRDDVDSGVDLRFGNDARESETNTASSARSSRSVDELTQSTSNAEAEAEFKVPARPLPKHSVRPSLSERTRMSIAFNSFEDVHAFLPNQEQITPEAASQGLSKEQESGPSETILPSLNARTSLLERTRESISHAPPPPLLNAKKTSHTRSRSSLHPVNQFETPRKARSSTISGAQDAGRRDATPIDQLLSPDAEYASVFKSRPRIALSPVLSPRQDADGVDHVALDADTSSPLGNVGFRPMNGYD